MSIVFWIIGVIVALIAFAMAKEYLGYLCWKGKHPAEKFSFYEYTSVISSIDETLGIYGSALAPYADDFGRQRDLLLQDVRKELLPVIENVSSRGDVTDSLTERISNPIVKLMVEASLFFRADLEDDLTKDESSDRWAYKYMNAARRSMYADAGLREPVCCALQMATDYYEWSKNGKNGDPFVSELTKVIFNDARLRR